jgi:acetylornithine/succinyldiaminopimelate/putrescine aminotransferase
VWNSCALNFVPVGKPASCSVSTRKNPTIAEAVVRAIADPGLLADVQRKGEWLTTAVARVAAARPRVRAVRGRGLMWGLEQTEPAAPFVAAARERRVLVTTAGPHVIRLIPPLVVSSDELAHGVAVIEEVLA